MTPADVDASLEALLPPSVMLGLHAKIVPKVDPEYGFDEILMGYAFAGAPDSDIESAKEILDALNTPCPENIAEEAVGRMRARTIRRAEDQMDMMLTIAVFSEDVANYPADVVIDGCRSWASQNKYFPSWSELKDMLDWRVRKRRLMREALNA
jgi:hypothetical protein